MLDKLELDHCKLLDSGLVFIGAAARWFTRLREVRNWRCNSWKCKRTSFDETLGMNWRGTGWSTFFLWEFRWLQTRSLLPMFTGHVMSLFSDWSNFPWLFLWNGEKLRKWRCCQQWTTLTSSAAGLKFAVSNLRSQRNCWIEYVGCRPLDGHMAKYMLAHACPASMHQLVALSVYNPICAQLRIWYGTVLQDILWTIKYHFMADMTMWQWSRKRRINILIHPYHVARFASSFWRRTGRAWRFTLCLGGMMTRHLLEDHWVRWANILRVGTWSWSTVPAATWPVWWRNTVSAALSTRTGNWKITVNYSQHY